MQLQESMFSLSQKLLAVCVGVTWRQTVRLVEQLLSQNYRRQTRQ